MTPECPRCRAEPGDGFVEIETSEFKSSNIFTGRTKYLVRTVQVPGICAPCTAAVRTGRIVADVLCLVPGVVLFVVGVLLDARGLMLPLLVYGYYLVSNLGYNWADRLVYGNQLELVLASFIPEGDAGSARLPVGWAHILVRVGLIPGFVTALGCVAVALAPLSPKPLKPAVPASVRAPGPETSEERIERARAYLENREFWVALVPDKAGGQMLRVEARTLDGRAYNVVVAYENQASAPAGVSCRKVAGRELVSLFLRRTGYAALVFEDAPVPLRLWRYELQKF